MLTDFFGAGSVEEIVPTLLLLFGLGSIFLLLFVWIGDRVLALRARPDRRALITASAAYGCASLLLLFSSGDSLSSILAPLFPLPGAVLVFLWLRRTYRAGWFEDDQVPEGMKLENSDWRVGLMVVAGVILAATLKVASQYVVASQ